jgi:Uma2 family endonuclease
MSVASPPRKYAAADLLTMPDGDQYKLVEDELVELELSNESSWVAGEIYRRVTNWATEKSLGWEFPDNAGYQCFLWDEDGVCKPDASFVSHSRLPGESVPAGFCPVAPDLAVQAVSPPDLYDDAEDKVREYLRADVEVDWAVTPSTWTIMVHRSDGD